ncbi:MAG TPA: signal recognition particle-docking protein FtsY [Thermoanaerobaculia bacterium]|mgnify:FL=1|nr:signal recognition particle-docking protein FtsY [Thermoanaerobaculia bacterium]HPA52043.1 signal recognition particle-docking protein FtsY [Thermoanaerobaculia bacterium]HQN10012.1 signal recognition particle-docking protein FtsY [Thermoanaerobaculia bacterium]HQP86912.1 signal recognition particle-docking protein FtsY [Thermoanaerobaculia bacterium]
MAEGARTSLMARLKRGLFMTHTELIARVGDAIKARFSPDPKALEALEEALLAADVGPATASELVEAVRVEAGKRDAGEADVVRRVLKAEIERRLSVEGPASALVPPGMPRVVLMVGVNGTGKTTTAAKLAARAAAAGGRPVLAAADTFRAAAIDQLEVWAGRIGIPLVKHRPGADPAAVVFDACAAAKARGADLLLVDTAGRLHTKHNLMEELSKIRRIAGREIPGAPHEVLLVLDAVTGMNGLAQAREFLKAAGVTGLVLTKMDGTAKGGVILAIVRELNLPVRYVGVGETADDLLDFDPAGFAAALIDD